MESMKEGNKQDWSCIQISVVGRHHQELCMICSITCAMSHLYLFQILPAERWTHRDEKMEWPIRPRCFLFYTS